MTMIVGVIGAALLFGVFTMLRQTGQGCTGSCVGCTHDGACEAKRADAPDEDARSAK